MNVSPSVSSIRCKSGISFLSLPIEVRNQIYSLVLRIPIYGPAPTITISPHPPHITFLKPCLIRLRLQFDSALHRTCQLIHNEVNHLLYARPNFSFEGTDCWLYLHLFLIRIGDTNRSLIREIHIESYQQTFVRTEWGTIVPASKADLFWPRAGTSLQRALDPVEEKTWDILDEMHDKDGLDVLIIQGRAFTHWRSLTSPLNDEEDDDDDDDVGLEASSSHSDSIGESDNSCMLVDVNEL